MTRRWRQSGVYLARLRRLVLGAIGVSFQAFAEAADGPHVGDRVQDDSDRAQDDSDRAQDDSDRAQDDSDRAQDVGDRAQELSDEDSDLVAIPIVAYGPETSWQFGAAGVYLLPRPDEATPRTNFVGSALISVREQFTVSLGGNAYFLKDDLRLAMTLDGFLWPTEFFTQVPPREASETYFYKGSKGSLLLATRLTGKWYAGPSVKFSVQRNDVPTDGLMRSLELTALEGHASVGPGISIALDSRDIGYAPAKGAYVGGAAHYLFGANAGTQGFVDLKLFGRWYTSNEALTRTLALACELRGVYGDAPFSLMATSDGTTVLRGLKRARYYDDYLTTIQVEYRQLLGSLGPTGPWGATLFAELGQFFSHASSFAERHPVVSVGAGLRYFVVPEDRVALRLDVSYVDAGVGVVLNALEAF